MLRLIWRPRIGDLLLLFDRCWARRLQARVSQISSTIRYDTIAIEWRPSDAIIIAANKYWSLLWLLRLLLLFLIVVGGRTELSRAEPDRYNSTND